MVLFNRIFKVYWFAVQAILVVGDATAKRTSSSSSTKKPDSQCSGSSQSSGSHQGKMMASSGGLGELSISHILGTSDILGGGGEDLLMDLG